MALTPKKIIESRELQSQKRLNLKKSLDLSSFDISNINNSIPNNLKPQGIQKLPSLFLDQGQKLLQKVVPILTEKVQEFGINELQSQIGERTNIEELKQQFCPTPETLDKLVNTRNNLVSYLNGVGDILDRLATTVNFGSTFASLLQGLVNISKITERIGNQVLKFVPSPLQGVANSALNLLGYVQDDALFTNDGTPRIPPLKITASQISPSVSTVQAIIFQIIQELNKLDFIINLCNPFVTLTDISQTIQDTANSELLVEQSENQTLYKGFIIEIEEKEFSSTLNQRRAVGKNTSNIVLIATEYSFASNPNVLIEELKFIIDRDDLKAY